MKKDKLIEKGRQVGDTSDKYPGYVWTKRDDGTFGWRKPKKGASTESEGTSKTGSEGEKKTPSKPSSAQIAAVKAKGGKMSLSDFIDHAKTMKESDLVKITNNVNGNAALREASYNALEERGFDVSTLDTSGTLQRRLDLKGGQEEDDIDTNNKDTEVEIDGEDEEGDEIKEKWYLNKNDHRVQSAFNKLRNKEDRIKYDQFVDKMKRKDPDYKPPIRVMNKLAEKYSEFLDNKGISLAISAGGAGVGKTYYFKTLAADEGLTPFDGSEMSPVGATEEGEKPSEYDYIEASSANSAGQLARILKDHNGKIILFDDTDRALKDVRTLEILKKASEGSRVVEDPDGKTKNFKFTGRIIFMTNASFDDLAAKNEDMRAVLSRAKIKSEINFTVSETIELLKKRFQDMEFDAVPRLDDEGDDAKERQEVLDIIIKNKNNIDPNKFTTRMFEEMMLEKRSIERAAEKRKKKAGTKSGKLLGSDNDDWRIELKNMITKADEVINFNFMEQETDLEKANNILFEEFKQGWENLTKGNKTDFSTKERKTLAKKGEALPDGSFPIRNSQDLKDAIKSWGRASDPERAKSWIKKRAKQLDLENLLPEDWVEKCDEEMDLQKAEAFLFGVPEPTEFEKAVDILNL
jgi:hypothetical protein